MKRVKQKLSIIVVFILVSSSCMSLRHVDHSSSSDRIDPVCGQVVSGDNVITTELSGITYSFDSEECRSIFLKNPERFTDRKDISQNHMTHWGIVGGSLMVVSMVVMMILF
ncbi:MAG: YHS domain-containing protein [Cyclobacteriaceae bacterium]|jgi:YHS domain-containing protein